MLLALTHIVMIQQCFTSKKKLVCCLSFPFTDIVLGILKLFVRWFSWYFNVHLRNV